ncbi:mammalian cell entry related domain-containing protein [Gordonia neofelifaecis NRRL B-59395]|uniref:Mammalian cell entry related domain-containing protein n=2 Tax=Gordonia TaxID=2053 RepID=F1YKY2_9ACTN|nr:mammalian cell entry related domain-containing protein [Gordonia neofelifaecis NRRL B-59395]
MLPGRPVSKAKYMMRGAIAGVLILAFALWMVGRSTGVLDHDPQVYAEVPVSAGLIATGAPVRFHGVKVGEVSEIDPGTTSSRVEMTVDEAALGQIPRSVTARILPRTFFGDIYVQLVPISGSTSSEALSAGDRIAVDDGPDAVNLYDVFTRMSRLIAEVQPQKLNVALAAVNKAVGGRGDEIGVMIDDWWAASKELESSVDRFIEATPQFREVTESLERATPDIIETMGSVADLSRGIAEHQDSLAGFLTAASGFVSSIGSFVAQERTQIITVLDATGKILSTIAENPAGVSETVEEAQKFGRAGAVLFSSGRFDITTVATFSNPMPYTAADCPTYGSLHGAQCNGTGAETGVGAVHQPGEGPGRVLNPPRRNAAPASSTSSEIVGGAGEVQPLGLMEKSLTGGRTAPAQPNAATTLMLGPMVRGTEVTVR